MVGWHHQLDGLEFEQALGDGEGQEIWHAAVHGVAKFRHDLATEQQQHSAYYNVFCPFLVWIDFSTAEF